MANLFWDSLQPDALTMPAREAIDWADKQNSLIVADISIWEVAMLINKKRLEVNATASQFFTLFLQSRRVSVVHISPEIAELSVNIGANMSGDPADRLIAATSVIHNARLVTADQNLRTNPQVDTLW